MEKKEMTRTFLEENIPVWEWNNIPLIRIGEEKFITAVPVKKDVRKLSAAKKVASEFSIKNNCNANVAYDTDWLELVEFIKVNFATKKFIEINNLTKAEVLLLDSMSEGETHVLAAGYFHRLDEIFRGFISGDDSDGEPQPQKVVFLTIKNVK